MRKIHKTNGNNQMMNRYLTVEIISILVVLIFMLSGCSLPVRQSAVPQQLTERAEVVGLPSVRYVVRAEMPGLTRDAMESYYREQAYLTQQGRVGALPLANFLALSGGGDNGAFGSGFLSGWTATGNRPEFKTVTGISTGGLIAPFAFLGPKYDAPLKEVFTRSTPKDILEARYFMAALFNDAMADNSPLERLLNKHVTEDMLKEIAREDAKGRLLLISTTNLDATQAIIWNMGKIAASGHPKAMELFRKIMLASAAIPGTFPPVMIDVVADGRQYQEMHVDGGATAQVFLYPPALKVARLSEQRGVVRERRLYLIRNARLDPDWAEVERRTLSIAGRAINSLIQSQGVGDLYKIYAEAQRDGIDFNLAYIPKSFNAPHKEEFDTEYMRQLFQTGYDLGVKGYRWDKTPPGL
jgi:hypothetical protein